MPAELKRRPGQMRALHLHRLLSQLNCSLLFPHSFAYQNIIIVTQRLAPRLVHTTASQTYASQLFLLIRNTYLFWTCFPIKPANPQKQAQKSFPNAANTVITLSVFTHVRVESYTLCSKLRVSQSLQDNFIEYIPFPSSGHPQSVVSLLSRSGKYLSRKCELKRILRRRLTRSRGQSEQSCRAKAAEKAFQVPPPKTF